MSCRGAQCSYVNLLFLHKCFMLACFGILHSFSLSRLLVWYPWDAQHAIRMISGGNRNLGLTGSWNGMKHVKQLVVVTILLASHSISYVVSRTWPPWPLLVQFHTSQHYAVLVGLLYTAAGQWYTAFSLISSGTFCTFRSMVSFSMFRTWFIASQPLFFHFRGIHGLHSVGLWM